ncbi:MAG: hypothetical protein P8H65_10970 [Rhodothermales bacterium]|nr:hypothetical protein [Rhodothermales bacterium]MDG2016496.1 hypothetical protein [Rhodothermales bacterium]
MKKLSLFLAFSLFFVLSSFAQDRMVPETFDGLKLRALGPGFMSGRISDIAIHPDDDSIWYVAVSSGGVWKTVNAGTTWESIFDGQGAYSTGSVSLDPSNPHVVWVGTGENVGGRHMGYGDGVYRSDDGGKSWTNMGLHDSEHVSEIIVHPENSDVVYVAAQGPLWSSGGDRGFYKSTDGGATWKKTLGTDQWVGVTDIAVDPRNPDWMYAATWQRHRTVAAYMSGGPGSGIHRSTDGGETWEEVTRGLPESNMGKIGLAISPQQPDIVYAAIELDRKTGGVFRSSDRGSSWTKMSDAVSGATGPHYYQELYASPHQFERLYLMDANLQISDDGGKTFFRMNEVAKHGDNHAIAFREDDPDYLLIGSDGGLYESFDLTKTWRFIENLPVTQYYKVALDDAEPFYNIFGGTQDNSTQGGPSRTDNLHGIQNSDWKIVLNWDGHQPATEPGNPNIMYAERQQGALSRIDMITGEAMDIQPQPGADEDYERFNWDAPILVSPHLATRIYFASHRLWKSDNRGDSWTAISGDLTRDQDRFTLPIMGGTQSWDNAWDVGAMSMYNTITSVSESPQQEGLIYVGTDDGLVQVTEDGGANWRKIEVGSMPGVPATAFVNDVKADMYDVNTVYVIMDNHKYGDYSPYVMKSTDQGRSWKSMRANLPDRTLAWRIVQDHVDKDLMFIAMEYGIHFTVDGGLTWVKLTGNMPTISFRDLAIHKRENDLVGASFGRGFFVLDDYTSLRDVSNEQLAQEATLFGVRKAWWYVPRPMLSFDDTRGSQGSDHYVAPNPEFGATFTYYLRDSMQKLKQVRQEAEKKAVANGQAVAFPGWDAVEAERSEADPVVILTVRDSEGNTVRRIEGPVTKGFHRVSWDLRYPSPQAVTSADASSTASGMLAQPGQYTVTMSKRIDGVVTELSAPQSFDVVPLREGALPGASHADVAAFFRAYENAVGRNSVLDASLSEAMDTITKMEIALSRATGGTGDLDSRIHDAKQGLLNLRADVYGPPARQEPGERVAPTVGSRLSVLDIGLVTSTYGPTQTHKEQLQIVNEHLAGFETTLSVINESLTGIRMALRDAGVLFVE